MTRETSDSKQTNDQQVVVAVGTKNPCKIEAVRTAFADAINAARSSEQKLDNDNVGIDIVIHAFGVPSGVSDQPIGDDETKKGAMNRAQLAYDKCIEEFDICNFAVGLEGGIEYVDKLHDSSHMWCMAWMAILGSKSEVCTNCIKSDQSIWPRDNETSNGSKDCSTSASSDLVWGYGKTGAFPLPKPIVDLIQNEGMELGAADDKIFNRVNSKHGSGTVGVLTNNMIDRSAYYVHALKLALIPWIWPNLYMN